MSLKNRIISLAKSQGADIAGIAGVDTYSEYIEDVSQRLKETGATGQHYMASEDAMAFFENLSDARRTLESANSIILIGVYSFDTEGDYSAARQKLQGKTARTYVYYPVVRQIAERVASYIEKAGWLAVQGQQIPLKYVADAIGLGTYGYNGLLLTEHYGSYLALRAVITDAKLETDEFEAPSVPCRDCGRCLKACPTGALYAPYKVNPTLCINPLTRHESDIPKPLREKMSNWVCGCDICQDVCPMNRKLQPRQPDRRAVFDPGHHASHQTLGGLTRCPELEGLLENDHMPVMQRNAIVALANIGSAEAMDILQQYKNLDMGNLGKYISWAINKIEKRTKGGTSE